MYCFRVFIRNRNFIPHAFDRHDSLFKAIFLFLCRPLSWILAYWCEQLDLFRDALNRLVYSRYGFYKKYQRLRRDWPSKPQQSWYPFVFHLPWAFFLEPIFFALNSRIPSPLLSVQESFFDNLCYSYFTNCCHVRLLGPLC